MKLVQDIIYGNKLQRHLVFSALVLVLLLTGIYLLYASGFRFQHTLSVLADCLFFLFCIYTGRWLCQRWYLQRRPVAFILYTLLCCLGLSVIKWLLVRYAFNHPFAGFLEVVRDAMPFFLIALVTGMLLKLIRTSLQKELNDAQVKAAQKESEFNVLQSHLGPHFLFNVLNTLYGISLEEQERVPRLLLKLSDLLRYSVYSKGKTFVPLKDELAYVQNYIGFEQIRISDRLVLATDIVPANGIDGKIAPLVLIVFVENAFKHAKNTLTKQIEIAVSAKIIDNFILFTVSNSYHKDNTANDIASESSGLGLANTIKRLELLYGNDYTLQQYTNNNVYHVELCLKLKG